MGLSAGLGTLLAAGFTGSLPFRSVASLPEDTLQQDFAQVAAGTKIHPPKDFFSNPSWARFRSKSIWIALSDCSACTLTSLPIQDLLQAQPKLPIVIVVPPDGSGPSIKGIMKVNDSVPSILPPQMSAFRPSAVLVDAELQVVKSAVGVPDVIRLVKEER